MADRAVVAAVSPGIGEAVRQLKVSGDFIAGQAFVSHPQGLVVDVTIQVTLTLQQVNHVLVAPGRPVVLGHNDLSLIAPANDRLVDIFRPWQRLTDLRPAQRVGVMQSVGDILCGFDQFLLFDIPQHF